MNCTSSDLLESYIKGKDCDQYLILESIYDENAEVVFEIASTQISFPEKIIGNKEIARVLSKDFNQKYHNVKTYCLSLPSKSKSDINNQKWLVVMRDISTGKTRLGTGYYNWQFNHCSTGLRIKRHEIYIHCMVDLADNEMVELSRIQGSLSYPWTSISQVREVIRTNSALHEVESYLNQ